MKSSFILCLILLSINFPIIVQERCFWSNKITWTKLFVRHSTMKSKPTTSLFRGIIFLILLVTGTSSAQVSETKITASDGEESEYFGWTTAIAGNYAIIGASEDDDLGPASGSAYIFKNVGSGWDEHQKLLASDGFSYDTFGNAVALSDSYAVVGAQFDDDAALNAGAVYVFKLENGIWIEATELHASDAADEDHFGSSVAISGDYIVVGASLDDDLGINSGSAYVFRRNDTTWIQEAKLLASDGEIDDRFEEVSISGDYIIVGAWGDKDQGDLTGAAYIFKREGSTWIQETKLTASDAGGGDQFGLDVSISGNYAIVGAYGNDDSGENSGSAYIFRKDSTGWIEDVKLTPGDGADFDEFGISVSILGEFALVGADVDDDSGENSGSAYLFRRDGSTWIEDLKLTASDGEPYDYFGISVALTENHLLIGAGGDDDNAFDAGAAYVFGDSVAVAVECGCTPPLVFKLNQNFPNPFNPSTKIEFRIADFGFVSLKVYDLLGGEIATLVNEEKPVGEYEVEFDGAKLTLGIYFYQLRTGKYIETKKMVLLR